MTHSLLVNGERSAALYDKRQSVAPRVSALMQKSLQELGSVVNRLGSEAVVKMNHILKPDIPYIGSIPGGVRIGTQVIIEGHVPRWFTHRFDFNLVVGYNPTHAHCKNADIAFHFNPRFDDTPHVILNTRSGRNWHEERTEYQALIRKGNDFEWVLTVEESYYRITINGTHFA